MRVFAASAFVALAPAAWPAFAQEDVQFEVRGKDVVAGSIRPADESEALLCRIPRGAVLKAAVKSLDKAGPVPVLELTLDGVPVDGVAFAPKGRGATLLPFAAAKTGLYKLAVRGDGTRDGDYQVALSWKPLKRFTGAGTTDGVDTFEFAAPRGALATILLTAAKGSPFVPNLVELEGPSQGDVVPLSGGGSARSVALPKPGDWRVRFKNDGAPGAYAVTVALAFAAPKKQTFDLRDGALSGAFSGGNTVVGGVLDQAYGGLVAVDDPDSPIVGSSVSVPPNSLGQTTSIFVAQAEPYLPPDGAAPAGPAVEFGPSGTQFDPALPATVTIPFDPDAFPGGTGAMVVYVKSADGTIEPVLPTSSYTFSGNTVTFTTSHFSTFQAATTADRGPIAGDYLMLELSGGPRSEQSGVQGVGTGVTFFDGNGYQGFLSRLNLVFDGPGSDFPPSVRLELTDQGLGGRIDQVDDQTFDVLDGSLSPVGRLRRGANGSYLVLGHRDDREVAATTLLVRRASDAATINALAGRWHVFVWETGATDPAAGATTFPLFLLAETGGLVLAADGTATFKMTGGIKRSCDFPGGWSTEKIAKRSVTGTMFVDPDQIVSFGFGDPEKVLGFDRSADGNLLFARIADFDRGFGVADHQMGVMLLVRESAGISRDDVAAPYAGILAGLDLTAPDDIGPTEPLGVRWRAETSRGAALPGALDLERYECIRYWEFDGGEPTISSALQRTAPPLPLSVTSAGALSVPSSGATGARTRDGGLAVFLRRDPGTFGLEFLVRLARPAN